MRRGLYEETADRSNPGAPESPQDDNHDASNQTLRLHAPCLADLRFERSWLQDRRVLGERAVGQGLQVLLGMIDVSPHIRALAALKRSEEHERHGNLDAAYSEACDARELIKQWQESIFSAIGLARNGKVG